MTVTDLDNDTVLAWVTGYERAWRSAGTSTLAGLFTDDAQYLASPYDDPVTGLAAIRAFWDEERVSPDEVFTMSAEVVACSGDTAVLRALVRYGAPVTQEYRDLWVLRFAADGRVERFEEWPFWPSHGRAPARTEPVVLSRAEVVATGRYGEWVRSESLSAGVYRLAAGELDEQSPHGEDEVYVVTAGSAELEIEGRRTPMGPGSVAFVPRRAPHRFVDISEDLEVSVVFAPPESSG
jgi:mannose-6-phosphate isomerase-like protein (cupin superfamily)